MKSNQLNIIVKLTEKEPNYAKLQKTLLNIQSLKSKRPELFLTATEMNVPSLAFSEEKAAS
jgi:hypothetical protein